jgi:hypothetical protein
MSAVILGPRTLRSSPFSLDYFEARERFRLTMDRLEAPTEAVPVQVRGPEDAELTIDVARLGSPRAGRLLVLSSGLHGAEGFFGSAAQLHWLACSKWLPRLPEGIAVLLLHGLNPFGFAWGRRANEDNVDLNRNFLLPGEEFVGSPPLYDQIYKAFNPTERPTRHRPPLFLRSLFTLWRHGLKELRHSLPVGQYDFPHGLFFGGQRPAETHLLLQRHLPRWLGEAHEIIHLDFHTGLGPWAAQKLLLDRGRPDEGDWWAAHFGRETVEMSDLGQTSYPTRGSFGPWLQEMTPGRKYHYAAAEYGTYPPLQVITALLTEARGYHQGLTNPRYAWTRHVLKEIFAPASPVWRRRVVDQAFAAIERALALLVKHAGQ